MQIDNDGFQTKIVVDKIKNAWTTSCIDKIKPLACSEATRKISLAADLIHHKCAHFHYGRIRHLVHHELITGLPTNLPTMEKPCPICLAMKSRKNPRKKKVDWSKYEPGESIHMDFAFMTETSIRGFTAFLSIKDAATNYMGIFLSRNKRPPFDVITFFISILKKENRTIRYVRVDEDGPCPINCIL